MRNLLCAVLAVLLINAPASAQRKAALALVPDDSLGFVIVKDLRQLSDKVDQLAAKLKVKERVSLLELIQKEMGIELGLNEKGSALFILMKGKKEKASLEPITALPVADHQKMAQALKVKQPDAAISEGEIGISSSLLVGIGGRGPGDGTKRKVPVLVAKKGDFVLLASPEGRDALERVLNARKSVVEALQPGLSWMEEQDVAGGSTHQGVKAGLAMILAGPGGIAGSSTQGQEARMKEAFTDLEKNIQLITFGARIDKEGHNRLMTRVYLDPESFYAKWLAKAEPLQGELLAHFPERDYALAALAHISRQTSFEGLARLIWSSFPAADAKELTADTVRLLQRTSEVGLTAYVGKAGPGSGRSALLAQVDDASSSVKDAITLVKKGQTAARAAKKSTAEMQVEPKEIAGRSPHLITFKETGADHENDNKKDLSSQNNWPLLLLCEVDARTVLICSFDEVGQADTFVRSFANRPEKSLGSSAALTKTAALLPERRQVELFVNIGPALLLFGLFGPASTGDLEAPPLGFALSTFRDGVEAGFVVPFETLQALFESVKEHKKPK
jgi:hypothetical protein